MSHSPARSHQQSELSSDTSYSEHAIQRMVQMNLGPDDKMDDKEPKVSQSDAMLGGIGGSLGPQNACCFTKNFESLYISSERRRQLCDIYLRNVDPVFKVLHSPSLKDFLMLGKRYLGYTLHHQAPDALASAVYYVAVCTIEGSECLSLFDQDKKTVLAQLRSETEEKLQRADVTSLDDLTSLQAFVLTLLAAHCQGDSRHVWARLALAVRVGQGLFLHMKDPPFHVSPFEREMRYRVWQGIGVLDLAASLDQASEPMIQAAWLTLPTNINDKDIWFDMSEPARAHPQNTFTDMTHSLIVAEAQTLSRSSIFTNDAQEAAKVMQIRQEKLRRFQEKVSLLLSEIADEDSIYRTYVKRTATAIYSWLRLGILRPISQRSNTPSLTLPEGFVLTLAIENLKRVQESYLNPLMAPWAWYGSLWAPWHGLAFALANMCRCNDPAAFVEYWSVVDDVYSRWKFVNTDGQPDMLSRGLKRLMHQAQDQRRKLLDSIRRDE